MAQRSEHKQDLIQPHLLDKQFPTETAFATFKDNMRQGFSKSEIWEFLEDQLIEEDAIAAGYQKLLFTLEAFIASQLQEGTDFADCKRYLLDKGYSEEAIIEAKNHMRH